MAKGTTKSASGAQAVEDAGIRGYDHLSETFGRCQIMLRFAWSVPVTEIGSSTRRTLRSTNRKAVVRV